MNKLEEYKQKLLSDSRKHNADDAVESGMETGFDAAIALDLPVKFAQWKTNFVVSLTGERFLPNLEKVVPTSGWIQEQPKRYSWEELYKYWIENIYKP